jgi:hypothetical protein
VPGCKYRDCLKLHPALGIPNRYQAAANPKFLELLKRISPVAWQHIHLLGHYAFRDKQHPINLEAILDCVNLQYGVDFCSAGSIPPVKGLLTPIRGSQRQRARRSRAGKCPHPGPGGAAPHGLGRDRPPHTRRYSAKALDDLFILSAGP